jgi:hypothetical protein
VRDTPTVFETKDFLVRLSGMALTFKPRENPRRDKEER